MPPPQVAYPPAPYPPAGYPPAHYSPTMRPAGAGFAYPGLRLVAVVLAMIIVVGIVEALLPTGAVSARKLAYPQPSVSISPNGTQSINVGASITFTATVNAGRDLTFTWDFGDGTGGSGQVVSHQYNTDSTQQQNNQFTVQLTATDPLQQSDTESVAVSVLPPLQASFTATQDQYSSDCYDFDASSSTGYNIQNYHWDFGDGSTDDTSDTQDYHCYYYDSAGTYTVTLTITDGLNRTSSTSQQVYNPGY